MTKTSESVRTAIEAALFTAVEAAYAETILDQTNITKLSQYLNISQELISILKGSPGDDHVFADVLLSGNESEDESDISSLSNITQRLINSFVIRGGSLINWSETGGWSYNIPKDSFMRVIEAFKSYAPKGSFKLDAAAIRSGVKRSHVYRIYVMLYRAGLMRQQSKSIYVINEDEAAQLNSDVIWSLIPRD